MQRCEKVTSVQYIYIHVVLYGLGKSLETICQISHVETITVIYHKIFFFPELALVQFRTKFKNHYQFILQDPCRRPLRDQNQISRAFVNINFCGFSENLTFKNSYICGQWFYQYSINKYHIILQFCGSTVHQNPLKLVLIKYQWNHGKGRQGISCLS